MLVAEIVGARLRCPIFVCLSLCVYLCVSSCVSSCVSLSVSLLVYQCVLSLSPRSRATKRFFAIGARLKDSVLSAADQRILYYRRPTKGFFTIGVRDKGFFIIGVRLKDSLLSASD